jgi:hypothetical protein
VKILFRKNDPGIYAALVRWWTHSPYSHCGLLLDERTLFQAEPGIGVNFSRRPVFYADHWDALEIQVSLEDAQAVATFCTLEDQCPYDWTGLFRKRSSKTAWFSSELCVAALQRAGLMPNSIPCAVTPGHLYKRLKEAGASPCVP